MKLPRRYDKRDMKKVQAMTKHAKTNTDKQAMVLAAQGKPWDHLAISDGFREFMAQEWEAPKGADNLDMDKLNKEARQVADQINAKTGKKK